MDVVVRGRRPLLIASGAAALTVAVATAACGGASSSSGAAVGVSERVALGGASKEGEARDAGARGGGAALPAGYRQTFTRLHEGRVVSKGHAAGRWEVEVWGNGAAREAPAARAKEVAPGAVVVQEHYEKGRPGPVMVMEKRERGFSPEHGDWRYAVVGASGALVRDGVIEQCAGCHDDAPMDGLFPITVD